MFDLRSLGLTDVLQCGSGLRRAGEGAASLEDASRRVVRYLYENLIDKETDGPALSLVRLYKTHRFDGLEPDLQAFAARLAPSGVVAPGAPCLTLLASAGEEPAWNDRRRSRGHRAIPLHDAAAIEASPMVHQLIIQLGLDHDTVVRPDPSLVFATGERPSGVFYVAEAAGSPHVPAQDDFVIPYGIRSVVGFGGLLPSGYVFAVVMFAKVEVPRGAADAFASLAFAAELALLPHIERRLFDSDPPASGVPDLSRDLRVTRAEAAALGHLLDTREYIITEQASRLERARLEAEERAEALVRSQARLEASEALKTAVLDAALDGVITMDIDGRVVDFNAAAERTFGYRREQATGEQLSDLIIPPRYRERHLAGLDRYRHTGEGAILGRRIEISAVDATGREFPVELTVTAAEAGGRRLFSGHVRDITERLRAEEERRAGAERYATIARVLQASLLPPELPVMPGAEVGSAYRAGFEGLEVGGDFYDLFEVRPSRWGIVLGDVMGKGPVAAATTALARHTVRAAAIRVRRPSAVLGLLNEALYRNDPERFCTAVFGFVDFGARPRLVFATGGHPAPLLRTAEGVATLDAKGRLLGPFRPWHGEDTSVPLHPGDLVLFYSDGVTEARRGRELFGADRLLDALAATDDAGAAATVARIAAEVDAFADGLNDDVAIIAFRLTGDQP